MINKNILIFVPMMGRGGVEKNLFIIANHFAKNFSKVSIISTSKEFKSNFDKKIKFISPKNNFWNKTNNQKLKILVCLILLIKQFFLSKKFEVISFQGNLYCCFLCKILKLKVILRSNSSIAGWYKGFFKRILYKYISRMADKIVVNSLEFKNEYKKKLNINAYCIYNPLNKIEIVRNAKKKINFSFYKKNYIKFINMGRLVGQKDQLTILKAFKLLKEKTDIKFKLLILGNGINKKKFSEYIKSNNLNKSIKILSFKKNPYPYLKNSDVFILSSLYEGLPNVLLESLVLKKFVISTNCPTGPKEILDNGKGGLFFKMKNELDLFNKITHYIKNKSKCMIMTKFGYRRLHRFDYSKNLNKYVELFNFN